MTPISIGDGAVTLEIETEISAATAAQVQAVAATLRKAGIAGVLDVVPAYTAVSVYYDAVEAGDFAVFTARLMERARTAVVAPAETVRAREIPVCYGGEYGPDMESIARATKRTCDEVVALHSSATYVVHAVGFAPGFGYLGGLPVELHCPRRATPRPAVPAGSVGIGGAQTGVYPLTTPGGWNLIGRTPLTLFDATRPEPSWFHAGDRVTFRAITADEFTRWA